MAKQDWKRLGSLRQLGLSAFVKRQSSREEVVYLNVEYPSDVEQPKPWFACAVGDEHSTLVQCNYVETFHDPLLEGDASVKITATAVGKHPQTW